MFWKNKFFWIDSWNFIEILPSLRTEAVEDRDVTFNQIKGSQVKCPLSTQDTQTTFKPNLTCIFLSARNRYIISIPNGWPCMLIFSQKILFFRTYKPSLKFHNPELTFTFKFKASNTLWLEDIKWGYFHWTKNDYREILSSQYILIAGCPLSKQRR